MNKIDFTFGKFPNGWPVPTFMSVNDGELCIEWCFGQPASEEAWRVSFYWTPDHGAMVIKTDANSQECLEFDDPNIAIKLNEWLTQNEKEHK